jgi:hypothetical protein
MNQDLENLALMIDGTPDIQMLTRNPDDHFGRDASGRSVEDRTAAGPEADALIG